MQKIYFPQKDDTTSFSVEKFYENGEPQYKTEYIKGRRDGLYIFYYENGNPKEIYQYRINQQHGVGKEYNKEGQMRYEFLAIHGKKVVLNEFMYNDSLKLWRMLSYLIENDNVKVSELGMLIFDGKMNIKEDLSFYYKVEGSDTLIQGKDESRTLKFFNKKPEFKLVLKLGNLDEDLKLTSIDNTFTSASDSIIFSIDTKNIGTHLLLGEVSLEKDTSDKYVIPFYYQYVVN